MEKKIFSEGLRITFQVTFLAFVLHFNVQAAEDVSANRWPVPDWEEASNLTDMQSSQCQEFKKFSTGDKVGTDGLLVIKDGQIQYEYYDDKHTMTTPHPMWSISKTVTGVLLGMAVRDGRISIDQAVDQYYPNVNPDNRYKKVLLKNLLYLDAGYVWNESQLDVLDNPVVNMLFAEGHEDMALFTAQQRIISQGPAYKWNYSTGLPTLTMGILKKVYGSDYTEMPWRNLFNPLGIQNITFERDHSGTYVGGASVFTTPRDIAKLGYLFLNNGYWNGEQLLPPEWMQIMLTPSPGYVSPGTVITDINDTGVYGGSLWLNRAVKKGFGKPYPHSPDDMFLGIGYNGQLLIMLPSQNMIIVRTGHDFNFNPNVDAFVSRALSCFYDPHYKIGSVRPKNPIKIGLNNIIRNIKNMFQAATLQSSIAKISCSCHFISGIDMPTCLKRNNFGLSKYVSRMSIDEQLEKNGEISVQVHLSRLARLFKHPNQTLAKAYYNPTHPEYGCMLR
jgi:CubicO group peptidase (beta-lactamase class C family)